MEQQSHTQAKTYKLNLTDPELSGQKAKCLLLTMVDNRIDYHNRESFCISIRNGKSSIDHFAALRLLQEAKRQVNGIIFQALESGYNITISGNLVITLPDGRTCKKVV
jgi:hypothetical protein